MNKIYICNLKTSKEASELGIATCRKRFYIDADIFSCLSGRADNDVEKEIIKKCPYKKSGFLIPNTPEIREFIEILDQTNMWGCCKEYVEGFKQIKNAIMKG